MNKSGLSFQTLGGGSLPHTDPDEACRLMLETLDIPTWPQLPRRIFLENMYVQFSERFPGVVLANERIYVDRDLDLDAQLEQLYIAYLANDLEYGRISPQYAAGLYRMLELDLGKPAAVKGQVTGPVSWGLTVVDQNRRPVLYDDVLAEALAKHLRLKATWLEHELKKLAPTTLLLIDEPYMSSFGSAYISLSQRQAVTLIEEVLAGIEGLKGLHCCGNTDWSLMMSTSIDILSFDAYEQADSIALYPDELQAFLARGGILAWGIVPASDKVFDETVEGLVECFERSIGALAEKGLHRDDLLAAAMITPSCGCGSLQVGTAEQVLRLTASVAKALKERYG
jgi:hypothetical protein